MKKIDCILVPTDFSEASNRALEYAFTLGSALEAKLLVLHVVDGRTLSAMSYSYGEVAEKYLADHSHEDTAAEVREVLDKEIKAGTHYDHRLDITTLVRYGVPYDQIVQVAIQEKADLIVMGSRGQTALADALLGSVATKVSRRATCPVFITRRRRHNDD